MTRAGARSRPGDTGLLRAGPCRAHTLDLAEIAARPAAWYASRPVPRRLSLHLAEPRRRHGGNLLADAELRFLHRLVFPYRTLSPVERAHRRQERALLDSIRPRP